MVPTTKFTRSMLALTVLCCWASTSHSQDLAAFQSSVQKLAQSSKPPSDPQFLAGVGELYCHMKSVVETDDPLQPETVLAVLHQKHPDTQAKSSTVRDAQLKAMAIAASLLCPDEPRKPKAQ